MKGDVHSLLEWNAYPCIVCLWQVVAPGHQVICITPENRIPVRPGDVVGVAALCSDSPLQVATAARVGATSPAPLPSPLLQAGQVLAGASAAPRPPDVVRTPSLRSELRRRTHRPIPHQQQRFVAVPGRGSADTDGSTSAPPGSAPPALAFGAVMCHEADSGAASVVELSPTSLSAASFYANGDQIGVVHPRPDSPSALVFSAHTGLVVSIRRHTGFVGVATCFDWASTCVWNVSTNTRELLRITSRCEPPIWARSVFRAGLEYPLLPIPTGIVPDMIAGTLRLAACGSEQHGEALAHMCAARVLQFCASRAVTLDMATRIDRRVTAVARTGGASAPASSLHVGMLVATPTAGPPSASGGAGAGVRGVGTSNAAPSQHTGAAGAGAGAGVGAGARASVSDGHSGNKGIVTAIHDDGSVDVAVVAPGQERVLRSVKPRALATAWSSTPHPRQPFATDCQEETFQLLLLLLCYQADVVEAGGGPPLSAEGLARGVWSHHGLSVPIEDPEGLFASCHNVVTLLQLLRVNLVTLLRSGQELGSLSDAIVRLPDDVQGRGWVDGGAAGMSMGMGMDGLGSFPFGGAAFSRPRSGTATTQQSDASVMGIDSSTYVPLTGCVFMLAA